MLLIGVVVVTVKASPLDWSRWREKLEPAPATLIPWQGSIFRPGAFVLARIQMNFINDSCSKFIKTMKTAVQVTRVLHDTALRGASHNQLARYGYILVRAEIELKDTLDYLTDLILCNGRDIWTGFKEFRNESSRVWTLLRARGINQRQAGLNDINNVTILDNNSTLLTNFSSSGGNTSILELFHKNRPQFGGNRQPKAVFLAGAGLGLLGGVLVSKIFGANNAEEIAKINRNINRNNKNIKLTNERIDILAKNISRSQELVKKILEKIVETNKQQDVHLALLWNYDQIITLNNELTHTFEMAEMTLTLLDNHILNPELIQLDSLKAIIEEGLKLFPNLVFPLTINRYWLHTIAQIIRVEKLGGMKYVMIIPLTHDQRYDIFTLVPHPIKIDNKTLALPRVQSILLKDQDETYMRTEKDNIYSITNSKHIMLDTSPIYRQSMMTCEWAVFQKKTEDILRLCDFVKAGETGDTFVIDADKHRLIFLTRETEVKLNCPGNQIKTRLTGLHNVSMSCDITTDRVHWPAKKTASIDVDATDKISFDATELPIAELNRSSKIHTSLRELVNKLPKETDPYTIDFDYYNLTMEQLHTYSIISQSTLTVIVLVNSVILGVIIYRYKYRSTTEGGRRTQEHRLRRSFRGLRDSLKARRNQLHREDFKRWGSSLRSRGSSLKGKIKKRFVEPTAPPVESRTPQEGGDVTVSTRELSASDASTNTPTQTQGASYPTLSALPRYW